MTMQPRPIPLRPDYQAALRRGPDHIIRAAFVTAMAAASGTKDVAGVCERLYPASVDKTTAAILTRAAAPVGSTTGAGFASELMRSAVADFLAGLAPASAVSQLMALGGLSFDLENFALQAMNFPARSTAPTTPAWVSENNPIPVSSEALAAIALGPTKKLATIVAGTREAYKRANGATVFATLLRENAAAGLDAAYFSADAGAGDAHRGLFYGAPTTTGAAGADAAALRTDVNWLIDQVAGAAGASGQVAFVGSLGRAAKVATRMDVKLTIIPSPAVPANRIVAVDPAALVHGSGQPDIFSSEEATIHMSTTPAAVMSAPPVRDLWQTNCIATRLILPIAFAKRSPGAVAYIDNVSW